MNKSLFAASLLCAGAASAQAPGVLGKVANVEGVVTISDGVTVGTAVPGTVITQGNRFVTASSGAARLTMDNGCVINLKPNESLLIDSKLSCRELIASVQAVGSNAAAAGVRRGWRREHWSPCGRRRAAGRRHRRRRRTAAEAAEAPLPEAAPVAAPRWCRRPSAANDRTPQCGKSGALGPRFCFCGRTAVVRFAPDARWQPPPGADGARSDRRLHPPQSVLARHPASRRSFPRMARAWRSEMDAGAQPGTAGIGLPGADSGRMVGRNTGAGFLLPGHARCRCRRPLQPAPVVGARFHRDVAARGHSHRRRIPRGAFLHDDTTQVAGPRCRRRRVRRGVDRPASDRRR